MNIQGIKMTQGEHDCVLSQLRKKNVGTEDKPILADDLTIEQWLVSAKHGEMPLEDAWAAKLKACQTRANLKKG